jgi:hypothetical protein
MNTFPLKERVQFVFRVEAFNVFNHTNLEPAPSDINSAGFGTFTSTRPQRILQFAGKITF